MTISLALISQRLPNQDLRLGVEELGDEAAGIFVDLRIADGTLALSDAKREAGGDDWLEISGSGIGFLGGDKVALRLLLMDAPDGRRSFAIRVEQPVPKNLATTWLARFDSEPLAIFAKLGAAKSCFVSSIDLARARLGKSALPEGWAPVDLAVGVTFREVQVTYEPEFIDAVKAQIGIGLVSEEAVARIEAFPDVEPDRPILCLWPERLAQSLSLDWLRIEALPPRLLLPLATDELRGPRLIQPGKLTFDRSPYDVEADFDVWAGTAVALFKTPPGFGVFQNYVGLPPNSLGDSFFKGVMGEVWLQSVWRRPESAVRDGETVLALGGSVWWDERAPIVLIPDLLELTATLEFQVEHPFTPETRQASGRMEGSLRLLHEQKVAASLTGSLEFPGWSLVARAESTDLGALWKAFGGEVDLPNDLRGAQVSVDLRGELENSSFGATIEFRTDSKWSGSSDGLGLHWGLEGISLAVSYAAGEFEFAIQGRLYVEDLRFDVAGGYEQGGWYLRGGMAPGTTLDVSRAVNNILQGLTLPFDMPPGLKLADVAFAANFNSTGYLRIQGRTDAPWDISKEISFSLQRLSVERQAGETNADLAVGLSLGGVSVVLEASKSEGWLFKGGTAPGTKIGFAAVYAKLSGKEEEEAKRALPDELRDFAVDALMVSYATESKVFEATCSGHLTIQGRTLDATVAVKGAAGNVDCLVDVRLDRDLVFKGKVVVGADEKAIIVGFKREGGKSVSLTDVLGKLLPSDLSAPPIGIGLKEALFAYYASKASKALVVGSTLDLDLALGQILPDPLKALIGEPQIGVENLRVLYATARLEKGDLDSLNKHLTALKLTSLPAEADAETKKIELAQGFQVSGSLKLGGPTPTPLMLPMAAPKPEGAGAAPAPVPGARETEPKVEASAAQWLDIGKSLGPLRIGRVGAQYADGKIGLLLDAAVDLAGLHIGLSGFAVHIPLQREQLPSFGLDGLELAYAGGPIEVAGALLRTRIQGQPDSYDGLALIKAPTFSIAGMGSITTIEGRISVFIFAALHAELGGPPAFRVQGIAGGLGYNRRLILPPIERVHEFPLVRAAMDASFLRSLGSGTGGSGRTGTGVQTPAQTALKHLANYVRPAAGEYWLAAGIKFNSFQMVTAVALVSVSFGQDVEIGLLGLAEMSLPRGVEKGKEVAYVELALRCSIKPAEGTVFVEGRLTDASYILSKDCRLTGGFAFCFWFSGPHAGDFVVTLGGYHPAFQPPSHYPVVPRLGVQWQITRELSVAAELYFALTPSCIMAGGRLAAIYSSSSVRAWFIIAADFLIAWEPLRYSITASLRIGFEVDLAGAALRVDLQAELRLWGPPFAGQLHVDLGILQVTVDFGERYQPPAALKAPAFKQAFLPKNTNEVLAAQVESGLLLQEEREAQAPLFVVSAHALALSVQSVVPLTNLEFAGDDELAKTQRGELKKSKLGVRPMAKTALEAPLTVSVVPILANEAEGKPKKLPSARIERIETGVPDALWQPAGIKEGELPETTASPGTMTATTGIRLVLDPIPPKGAAAVLKIADLQYENFLKTIPALDRVYVPVRKSDDGVEQAMSDATGVRRGPILDVLERQRRAALQAADEPAFYQKVNLKQTAERHEECFRAKPRLWFLGQLEAA